MQACKGSLCLSESSLTALITTTGLECSISLWGVIGSTVLLRAVNVAETAVTLDRSVLCFVFVLLCLTIYLLFSHFKPIGLFPV